MSPAYPSHPEYFRTPEELSAWFEANPAATELWVGLWKKGFERPGIAYADVVDEALCNGWIDSIIRRVGEASYMIRLTPRRPKSNWTEANLRRVEELRAMGRLRASGARAAAVAAQPPRRPGH
jgi:uncharacterized protein YdeI (YjbR/CyaY-like superfamily)